MENNEKPIGNLYEDFNNALLDARKIFNDLLNENNSLKKRLELLENSPDLNNFKELLANEGIIDGSEKIISKIVRNLRDRLGLKTSNKEALAILIADNSGSMGVWEKYISKCFMLWVKKLLEEIYKNIGFKFIVYTTVAEEVNEEEFNKVGESGGTIISSAYIKANSIIEEINYMDDKDVYVFHVSDGDNLTSDNNRCKVLAEKIKNKSKLFGYLEVNPYSRRSTLSKVFNDNCYILKSKEEVYSAIKYFLEAL